jgi:hypothetical protein
LPGVNIFFYLNNGITVRTKSELLPILLKENCHLTGGPLVRPARKGGAGVCGRQHRGIGVEEGLAIWVLGFIPSLAVARSKDGALPAVEQEDVSDQHRLHLSVSKIFR